MSPKVSRREFVVTTAAGVAAFEATRLFAADALFQVPAGAVPPLATGLAGEDGYKLWLRYAPPPTASANEYRQAIRQIVVEGTSRTAEIIRTELNTGLTAMLGATVPAAAAPVQTGALLVGTPSSSSSIKALGWDAELAKLGPEGFVIRAARVANRDVIAIASSGEIGALYGTYHFLRLMQTAKPIARLNVAERPKLQLRMLNHWDNLNGTIERGYAGRSLWKWNELPGTVDPRYADYARANASIGVNGAVINNVNAQIQFLTPEYLGKIAALAGVWRPYGVRLYLSVNFAAPVTLGGLKTADPLDATVAAWWKAKADEIYGFIPDFGGFLVKANSEGQPGPKDYNRSHAEGANVMADALAPHKGTVIWRAFIYDEEVDPDRAKRAYIEFTRLDGQFKPNVLVQIKNGAIDFMPREPFHPLFGALKQTPALAEIQATQEYLGQARHLVYLGTMWKEFLDSDTFVKGPGSTVGKALDGTIYPYSVTGMVSVTNPGQDPNWCGHHFSQANWYAAGRLAWNYEQTAEQIAEDWTRQTFTNDTKSVGIIRDLMMGSREAFVNYTMPLGLHHLIGGDHYAPMPQNAGGPRRDWTAVYYHQAAEDGVGFNRTMRGNRAVGQYSAPVRDMFDSTNTCPERYLLWFHRCPWDFKTKSGKTLWDDLCAHYYLGARQAAEMEATWRALSGQIDPRRHKEVADRMAIQTAHAAEWRDQILKYFQTFSKRPIPAGL